MDFKLVGHDERVIAKAGNAEELIDAINEQIKQHGAMSGVRVVAPGGNKIRVNLTFERVITERIEIDIERIEVRDLGHVFVQMEATPELLEREARSQGNDWKRIDPFLPCISKVEIV